MAEKHCDVKVAEMKKQVELAEENSRLNHGMSQIVSERLDELKMNFDDLKIDNRIKLEALASRPVNYNHIENKNFNNF